MNTLLFLAAVAVLLAAAFLAVSKWGGGLVEDARAWWRLRSMQVAAGVALVPQLLDALLVYVGDLMPEAQAIFLTVLPEPAQNALTVAGALFAFYRLVRQRAPPRMADLLRPRDPAGG